MRARMLAAFFLIILFNTILLVVSFLFGYSSSRKYWNYLVEQESRKVVMEFLTGVMETGGVLNSDTASRLLDDYDGSLVNTAQVFLFSPDQRELGGWVNPTLTDYKALEADVTLANPLYLKDQLRGYVEIVPLKFRDLELNNIFISRIIQLLILGLIISTGLSLLLAFSISGTFTKEARNTARSLINLAAGSRREEFFHTPTRELASINKAAGSLQSMLISEEQRRQRWSTSIAHDLRTPLTAMRTQFTACRDGALALDEKRWNRIIAELDTMESLTRDFLILGELDSPVKKLMVKRVKTESLKLSVFDSLQHMADLADIALNWTSSLEAVYCDYDLCSRALEALVKNALQHSPAGSEVKISLKGSSESPVFTIVNRGHIPEEHLDHIFDPLYKTDNSRKMEGSGLGLTIASRIAAFHNGSIEVKNLPEHSVSFDFSLNQAG
ncbi:MAG: HAMP domain-containing sensor histidine kinase [Spirochaetales bacterium]|nr:HAMP domain-containing sensor histidine kinase [Spirochaetales bacterium]